MGRRILQVKPRDALFMLLTGIMLAFYQVGSIPTALAYAIFMGGIRTTSATITSIVTLCEPLTSACSLAKNNRSK